MSEEIKEDFLEVDTKIPGQNYVCLSFVSPEKILKRKELFFTTKFLEYIFKDQEPTTQTIRDNMLNGTTEFNYTSIETLYDDWKYSRTNKIVIKHPKT